MGRAADNADVNQPYITEVNVEPLLLGDTVTRVNISLPAFSPMQPPFVTVYPIHLALHAQERTVSQANLPSKLSDACDVVFTHPMAVHPPQANHTPAWGLADALSYPVPGARHPRQDPAGPLALSGQRRGLAQQPRSWSARATTGGRGLLPPVDAESDDYSLPPGSPLRAALPV
jgi:hypothetical protein